MRNYIVIGIAAIIIVILGVTLYILYQEGGQELVVNVLTKGQFAPSPAANAPTIVSFTVNKTKNGTVLIIEWRNLPNGTKELVVWKAPSGTAAWKAWQTISVSAGSEGSGSATIDIGTLDLKNFDFSLQALGNPGGESGGSSTTERVLWTSPVIQATTTASGTITFVYNSTSTPNLPSPSSPPATSTPPPAATTTTTNTTPSQTPTSTAPTPPPATTTPSSAAPTSSTSGTSGNNSNPVIYYYTYTPQQTPSAQAVPEKGSFWVQHVDQKIEIGWQNLPQTTTKINVSRSANQAGPWTIILTQSNPDPTGPYSIKLVDSTLNNPYYYKLDAFTNSTIIQTFGPVYLAPI